jgi:hypothetical protein
VAVSVRKLNPKGLFTAVANCLIDGIEEGMVGDRKGGAVVSDVSAGTGGHLEHAEDGERWAMVRLSRSFIPSSKRTWKRFDTLRFRIEPENVLE